jgi:hypothetical protein
VSSVLRDRARKLRCPVSDLAWALGGGRSPQGLYPVLVKRWEIVEREQWEAKKEQGNG